MIVQKIATELFKNIKLQADYRPEIIGLNSNIAGLSYFHFPLGKYNFEIKHEFAFIVLQVHNKDTKGIQYSWFYLYC